MKSLTGTVYEPTGEMWVQHPEKKHSAMLRTCKTCGKAFYADIGNVRKGMGLTCSLKCSRPYKGHQESRKCRCLQCGKEFLEYASRIQEGKGRYCSKECYSKSMTKDKIALVCEHCGKTFMALPWRKERKSTGYSKAIFCSHRCSTEANITGTMVPCEHCGKEFYRQIGSSRRFCSRACCFAVLNGPKHHLWKEDKIGREGNEFTGHVKKKILDKYGWKCAVTGDSVHDVAIQFHHIVPISKGGKGVPSNGIPLREDIHWKVHHEGFDIRAYIKE